MWVRGLHYSVDLRIQTYAEPVQLEHGKLALQKNVRGYTNIFYSVCVFCLNVLVERTAG